MLVFCISQDCLFHGVFGLMEGFVVLKVCLAVEAISFVCLHTSFAIGLFRTIVIALDRR